MKKYEDWDISGYLRPELVVASDGEIVDTGAKELVVLITDSTGREWHVTVEKDATTGLPILTSLLIRGAGPIDKTAIRETTTTYLAEAAWTFVLNLEQQHEAAPMDAALEAAATQRGQVSMADEDLTMVEKVAQLWNSTEPIVIENGERIGRRESVARQINLSVWSVDKYVKTARAKKLIEPAPPRRKTKKPKPTPEP